MSAEKLNLTEVDFKLQDEGTIAVLHPCNDAAREWIDEHIYGQDAANLDDVYVANPPTWWGGGIVIEHRYVQDILQGIVAEGLDVGPF